MKNARLLCAFLAAAVAAVFAVSFPCAAWAATYDISDEDASGGRISLMERDSTYNVTSDLHYPIRVWGDDIVVNFNGHKLELASDSTGTAIYDDNNTYAGSPTCVINDAVVVNNGSGEGIYTNNTYFTLNNCSITTQDNYCFDVNSNLLAVNGGTYTRLGGTGALARVCTCYHDARNFKLWGLRIFGGTFTAPEGSPMVVLDDNGGLFSPYVLATGGTFSYPDIATYVNGKAVVKGADGKWAITDKETADQDSYTYVELGYEYHGNGQYYYYTGQAYFAEGEESAAEELASRCGAKVKDVTRTVTFDAGDGSPTPDAQVVSRGKTASEPTAPHKVGYKLAGWLNKETGEVFSFSTPITDDITLVANYQKADDCKITFDAGEGSFPSGADYAKTVAYDAAAAGCEPSEKPVLAGKVFAFWSLDGETEFDFDSAVTTDIELVAVWADAVAECDGLYYASLGEAVAATEGTTGKTVKLLADDAGSASVSNAANLTIDLGGHTYKTNGVDEPMISLTGCTGATVTNGRIEPLRNPAVKAASCSGLTLKGLTVVQDIEGAADWGTAIRLDSCDGAKLNSLTINQAGYCAGAVKMDGCANATLNDINVTLTGDCSTALILRNCGNAKLGKCKIEVGGEEDTGVALEACAGYELSGLDVTASGKGACGLDAFKSSGDVLGGSYKATNKGLGAMVIYGEATFDGATVTSTRRSKKDGSPAWAVATAEAKITVANGSFTDFVNVNYKGEWDYDEDDEPDFDDDSDDADDAHDADDVRGREDINPSELTVRGGFFGSPDNAGSVVEGKCLLKRADGVYEVVDEDVATSYAKAWVDLADARVWYEDASEALSYATWSAADAGSSLPDSYNVATYVSRKKTVMTGYVLKGGALNYLPEGEVVAGYTFAGWYVDSSKKDASFVPEGDVTLTAMWVKDGEDPFDPDDPEPEPDPEPVPTPEPDSGSDDDSSEGGPDGEKNRAMPQTGDSALAAGGVLAAGAGIAAAGFALRRRS